MIDDVHVTSLGCGRPRGPVKVMIAQVTLTHLDFRPNHTLWDVVSSPSLTNRLDRLLEVAAKCSVDILVFPELSVPEDYISRLSSWAVVNKRTLIIGGTHYVRDDHGAVSCCPVLLGGSRHDAHKVTPSDENLSPTQEGRLKPGARLRVFTDTPVGTLSSFLCSDFLETKNIDSVFSPSAPAPDIVCIPSCDNGPEGNFHKRIDYEITHRTAGGFYVYANLRGETIKEGKREPQGRGHSAVFGLMWSESLAAHRHAHLTDENPPTKIVELPDDATYQVLALDLERARLPPKKFVGQQPNVQISEHDWDWHPIEKRDSSLLRTPVRNSCALTSALQFEGRALLWTEVWKELQLEDRTRRSLVEEYLRQVENDPSTRCAAYA